jgi:hemerythrin-like metal-binding protein
MGEATGLPAAGAYAVGWPAIDELHAECDALLAAFARSDDAGLTDALALLHQHLLDHFGLEEALMEASSYPRFDCHKREHDAVLRVVERVRPMCAAGDATTARRLGAEFPQWFSAHAGSMDLLLAAWLREQSAQSGNVPVAECGDGASCGHGPDAPAR